MKTKNSLMLPVFAILLTACSLNPATMPKPTPTSSQPMMQKEETMMQKTSYLAYTPQAYSENKDLKRVLFFKANWCPTCNIADKDFLDNIKKIPEGVVLYQVDYDTQKDLKNKYAITYQHTFVQVDQNDQEVAKWNGGGVDNLLANLK